MSHDGQGGQERTSKCPDSTEKSSLGSSGPGLTIRLSQTQLNSRLYRIPIGQCPGTDAPPLPPPPPPPAPERKLCNSVIFCNWKLVLINNVKFDSHLHCHFLNIITLFKISRYYDLYAEDVIQSTLLYVNMTLLILCNL